MFFDFGPFTLRMSDSALLKDGEVVPLRFKVFETLRVLVEEHGHIIGRDRLLDRVWPGEFVEESSVTQNISLLRRVLDPYFPHQRPIETISKKGYRFAIPVKVRTEGDEARKKMAKGANAQVSRSLIGQVLVFSPSQVADAILAAQGRSTLHATLLPVRPEPFKAIAEPETESAAAANYDRTRMQPPSELERAERSDGFSIDGATLEAHSWDRSGKEQQIVPETFPETPASTFRPEEPTGAAGFDSISHQPATALLTTAATGVAKAVEPHPVELNKPSIRRHFDPRRYWRLVFLAAIVLGLMVTAVDRWHSHRRLPEQSRQRTTARSAVVSLPRLPSRSPDDVVLHMGGRVATHSLTATSITAGNASEPGNQQRIEAGRDSRAPPRWARAA